MAAGKKNKTDRNSPIKVREAALKVALEAIEKNHGEGSVIHMDDGCLTSVQCIPTGSLTLDLALGGGGLPRGRVIELYGPEGSGKSTLALSVIAQVHKAGGYAAYIDAEHAFDPDYAKNIGVNLDGIRFSLSQPSTGEEGLDICERFVKSGAVDVVVIDSVAALVPRVEIEGEIGDTFVGVQARMMSQALRRLTAAIGKTDCVVIFINQLREKIGVMFGNPETTPGGRALKFYSTIRIDVRRIGALKQGEEIVGNRTKATIVKNKVAPPFRRAEFDIIYGKGISFEGDVIELGMQHGLVKKAGAWFSCQHPQRGEIKLGQGREAARQLLIDNPDLCQELVTLIHEAMAPTPVEKSEPLPAAAATEKEMEAGATSKGKREQSTPKS